MKSSTNKHDRLNCHSMNRLPQTMPVWNTQQQSWKSVPSSSELFARRMHCSLELLGTCAGLFSDILFCAWVMTSPKLQPSSKLRDLINHWLWMLEVPFHIFYCASETISLTHASFSDKYSLLTWTIVRKPLLRLLVNITKDLPVLQFRAAKPCHGAVV